MCVSAVATVERLMSFHDRHSQLSLLNRLAHRAAVRVHPWTWDVMQRAQRISAATRGLFDVSVGHALVRMGYLPQPVSARRDVTGDFRDIELLRGHRVRFRGERDRGRFPDHPVRRRRRHDHGRCRGPGQSHFRRRVRIDASSLDAQ